MNFSRKPKRVLAVHIVKVASDALPLILCTCVRKHTMKRWGQNNFSCLTKMLYLLGYFQADSSKNIQIYFFPERANLQSEGIASYRPHISRFARHRNIRVRSSRANVTPAFSFNRRVFHVKIFGVITTTKASK